MKITFLRTAVTLASSALIASAAFGGGNVTVTIALNSGAPASLSDTYAFFAVDPGGTTPAVGYSMGTVTNGSSQTFSNPAAFGFQFEYVVMGEYTDTSGVTHVALGTENDLTGDAWTTLFPQSSLQESDVAADLASGATGASNSLASDILGYFVSNVYPIGNYSTQPAFITGFSNGVNLGSITTSATPEPSSWLALGLAPLVLMRRRRR